MPPGFMKAATASPTPDVVGGVQLGVGDDVAQGGFAGGVLGRG
jgi:hypothetical protein